MSWFRYLKYGENTSSTIISNNYQYPNLRRKIDIPNPVDDIEQGTWIFVNLNDIKIDKFFNTSLEIQTQDRSYIVVYQTDINDDYTYQPVETIIIDNSLYFKAAEKHFADEEIQKKYYVYYKTKNIKNIKSTVNRHT